MDTFIQNKTNRKDSMLHELWILGMPTIVEQLLQTVVSYVDTAMVGQIGAIASAAIGLTATVNWLFNGMFFAVSMGMLSYIARYTGEGDVVMAHRTSSQALWGVVFLGIAETIIADQSGIAAVDGRKQGNMERCERIFFHYKLSIAV